MTQTPSHTNPSERQDPMSRNPMEFEFGLFVADNPGYGGVQGFLWFLSEDEALAWLLDEAPALFDAEDAPDGIGGQLAALLADKAPLATLPLEGINRVAEGCFEIRWAGKFDDLMFGENPFEREIQADFHGMVFPDKRGQGPDGTMDEDYAIHLLNYHSH